jgi:hypothetical protein
MEYRLAKRKTRCSGVVEHTEKWMAMNIGRCDRFVEALRGRTALPCTALIVAVASLGLAGIEARAAPFETYGVSGSGGVFAVSCSGPGDGGLPNGNIVDNRVFFKPGSDCTNNPLTLSANSSFSMGSVTASGSTTSTLGSISGVATMNTGTQNSILFPAGFTDAGWIDTLLLEDAATTGQLATVSVILHVSGVLSATGPNVVSRLQLAVSSEAAGNPALHQPSYQIQAPSADLVINETLILDLPFIVGTPSQLLVRAMARAMTSSSTSFGDNTSTVNFLSTLVPSVMTMCLPCRAIRNPAFSSASGAGLEQRRRGAESPLASLTP